MSRSLPPQEQQRPRRQFELLPGGDGPPAAVGVHLAVHGVDHNVPLWDWEQVAEGWRWLTAALARSAREPVPAQARVLTVAGGLAVLEGDVVTTFERGRTAASLAQECGDLLAEAGAHWIAACGWHYGEF